LRAKSDAIQIDKSIIEGANKSTSEIFYISISKDEVDAGKNVNLFKICNTEVLENDSTGKKELNQSHIHHRMDLVSNNVIIGVISPEVAC
jgi:hypothetical protein